MNVIQRPREREFCATMRDYIIDTDRSITFSVEFNGKRILSETYVPDADYQVRIRKLGRFCALALWGMWPTGDVTSQPNASGMFVFYINDVKDFESFVIYSRLESRLEAASVGVLSDTVQKVTRRGCHEYVSGFLQSGGRYTVSADFQDGHRETLDVVATGTDSTSAATLDVSVDSIEQRHGWSDIVRYSIGMSGGTSTFLVDQARYADIWQFRFKNNYDMPEVLTCTGQLKIVGANQSDTAAMYGIERKFGVKVTDEYTVKSGPIFLRAEYRLWHSLLNAQQASVWVDDRWLDIVITKQKLERSFNSGQFCGVEFSFRIADPDQNNLIV